MSYNNFPICILPNAPWSNIPENIFARLFYQNSILTDLLIYEKCQGYKWTMCSSPMFPYPYVNDNYNQDINSYNE